MPEAVPEIDALRALEIFLDAVLKPFAIHAIAGRVWCRLGAAAGVVPCAAQGRAAASTDEHCGAPPRRAWSDILVKFGDKMVLRSSALRV